MTDPLDPDEPWRIVETGERRPEPVHHGLDAAMLDRVDRGEAPPTLRFWRREEPAILIGRFQAYADEVAVDHVEKRDLTVVRRITGGGAVYVQPRGVVTYSLAVPRDAIPDDVAEGFRVCNEWAAEALRDLGVEAYHDPLNDISHPEGKIAGAAQLRRENAVLHHAVLTHTLDVPEMLRALRIGEEKLSDKAVESAERRVAPVGDHLDVSPEEVVAALRDRFESSYGGEPGDLTDAELTNGRERASERFADDSWTRRR